MACGFFVALILSKHVWLTARHFPLVPVFSRLPPIPYPVDYVLLAGLAILLGLIAASTAPKLYISAFLFLLVVLALLDQCRWQPWTYQYSLMLATLAVFYWKGGRADDEDAALNICRLIMASVYFYSGLQKLNPTFTVHVFPHLLDGEGLLSDSMLQVLAIFPPFIEASIGIGLLIQKFRQLAVVAAVVMHGFVLLKYGPLGFNYNTVVWPWNLTMIALDLILFWRTELFSGRCRVQKSVCISKGHLAFSLDHATLQFFRLVGFIPLVVTLFRQC